MKRVKKFEAASAVDANGQPIVPKVRKYTKSGALRKPYKSRKLAAEGENKPDGGGLATADHTLDQSTANSSLNSTLQGGPTNPPVITKRKYQKRKKPEETSGGALAAAALGLDPSVASTPAGSTGLAKVEGTKLIIQKKAIKLALNSANSSGIYLFSSGWKIQIHSKITCILQTLLQ